MNTPKTFEPVVTRSNAANNAPPPEAIRAFVSYDPKSGEFSWIQTPNRQVKPGAACGSLDQCGYTKIMFKRRRYLAHRLAWWFVNGEMPKTQLDHINNVKTDNRIANLRPANCAQNKFNTPPRLDSKTGFRGVTKRGSSFRARMRIGGKLTHLGTFDTAELAAAAYADVSQHVAGAFEHPSVAAIRAATLSAIDEWEKNDG